MDYKSYTTIIFLITVVPAILVIIICLNVWRRYPKSEELMHIIMKGIISRKNIDNKPTYLVCNRKLPSSNRRQFMVNSIFIITICVMCFSSIAIIEVTYECLHDPDLDCFKKKDDVKLSDFLVDYDESPINCSMISRNDFVICYGMISRNDFVRLLLILKEPSLAQRLDIYYSKCSTLPFLSWRMSCFVHAFCYTKIAGNFGKPL